MSFAYNDEGMRTSKTVAGVTTNYYYNGSQLISEETNGKVKVYLYNSTGVIGFRYRTSSYGTYARDTFYYLNKSVPRKFLRPLYLRKKSQDILSKFQRLNQKS